MAWCIRIAGDFCACVPRQKRIMRAIMRFRQFCRVDGKVLIAYKNGVSHGWEKEGAAVSLEQAVLDVASQRVERVDVLYAAEERIAQMGEYVRMPNGDIGLYIDMQDRSATSRRTGMEALRSRDGGRTYCLEGPVGLVDGVEYGYPLNFCEKNGRVYMATMTFPYLAGSKGRRQVHVISSADSGASWRFEANLTGKLGAGIQRVRLDCHAGRICLVHARRSAAPCGKRGCGWRSPGLPGNAGRPFPRAASAGLSQNARRFFQVGRPRLYEREGRLLLITRQHIATAEGVRMALDLFVINLPPWKFGRDSGCATRWRKSRMGTTRTCILMKRVLEPCCAWSITAPVQRRPIPPFCASRISCSGASIGKRLPGNLRRRRDMISEKLRGVLTASITPVAENGALDCDAVARLVKYYRQSGLRGALFPSSTGESFALTAEERVALVRVAAHAASDDFSILGNCSEHNWKDALRNARAMADAGADVAVCMPPQFLAYSQEELRAYFYTIADQSPIPLLVYNHMTRLPNKAGLELLGELAKHENIVGIKDTHNDPNRMLQIYAQGVQKDFAILCGGDGVAAYAALLDMEMLDALQRRKASGCSSICMPPGARAIWRWPRAISGKWIS